MKVSRQLFLKGISILLLFAVPLQNTAEEELHQGDSREISGDDGIILEGENPDIQFSHQFDLLNQFKNELMPHIENHTDLYFVGFGSDSGQDVFMKEIIYIKDLMDNEFGTKGRSIALVNNQKTTETLPIASPTNLMLALNYIGEVINTEEDILLLYLTTHGSRDHVLLVDMPPLYLEGITPDLLGQFLDDAKIKYRILLVSACFSGGFLEPLKNENTLIFTAAAHDRPSFGCSHASEFTYFGQAVFAEGLSRQKDFIKTFKEAIERISRREEAEELRPSLPQLYIGEKMEEKLRLLAGQQEYLTAD